MMALGGELLDSSCFSVAIIYNWKGWRTAGSSAVGIAASYELEGRGFEYHLLRDLSPSAKRPDWPWGSPILVFDVYLDAGPR